MYERKIPKSKNRGPDIIFQKFCYRKAICFGKKIVKGTFCLRNPYFLFAKKCLQVLNNVLMIDLMHVRCLTTEESNAECEVMCQVAKCKQSSTCILTSIQNTNLL
jgi:hypothetical protein